MRGRAGARRGRSNARVKLPLMPLSTAHEMPLSATYASLLMLPAPTAVKEVEEGSGHSERLLPLLRLLLRLPLLLLSAPHATPLSIACASLTMLPVPTAVEEGSGG